uniref:Acetyltransferase n=1 Tax=Aegilops tauschii subsp. strangulata TaxID=200361 RepID=A0A453J4K0_AEGTS
MGDVRIVSRRMVRPDPSIRWPPEHQPETIHPTPWDLRMLAVDYIQKGVLLPKTPAATTQGQGRNIPVVDRLSSSFASALGRFYHLAGRLAVNDDGAGAGQTISLRCSNEGAEFVHAVAPGVTVADITAPLCIPRVVWSFFPLNGVLGAEAATGSCPVLAAQVTDLDDGVFVAMSLNHGVADWTTFWHLFNTWSEISRRSVDGGYDCEISSPLPVFERWFPNGCAVPIPVPLGKLDDIVGQRRRAYGQRPPVLECFVRFSGESVKNLVSKANAEMSGSGTTISSLQAMLAHLWRAVFRARRLAPEQDTRYVHLVGCRGRADGMPAAYSGSAVSHVAADSTAGEILEKGLGRAAWLLNRAVASFDGARERGGARGLGPGAQLRVAAGARAGRRSSCAAVHGELAAYRRVRQRLRVGRTGGGAERRGEQAGREGDGVRGRVRRREHGAGGVPRPGGARQARRRPGVHERHRAMISGSPAGRPTDVHVIFCSFQPAAFSIVLLM